VRPPVGFCGLSATQSHVPCPPPWPRHAVCPTRTCLGPIGWPLGRCWGGRTIHLPSAPRTRSPTAGTQATLDPLGTLGVSSCSSNQFGSRSPVVRMTPKTNGASSCCYKSPGRGSSDSTRGQHRNIPGRLSLKTLTQLFEYLWQTASRSVSSGIRSRWRRSNFRRHQSQTSSIVGDSAACVWLDCPADPADSPVIPLLP
jgi:hypothetical protein